MDKKPKKRGRPEFVPTAVQRRKVEVAVAFGMAHEDIAMALGISRGTLLKYFDSEISVGAAKRRMETLQALFRTAIKGNVSAQRALLAMPSTATVPLSPSTEEAAAPAATPPTPGRKLGKKEQAKADAVTAGQGGEWGDLLNPGAATLQ